MAIKAEIERRWGTIDLLDILKYAEFDTDFIAEFTSVATRENLSKDVDMNSRLELDLATTANAVPGPRRPESENATAPA
ncbi:hypothetical protein [Streptomyces sp. NPDC001774]